MLEIQIRFCVTSARACTREDAWKVGVEISIVFPLLLRADICNILGFALTQSICTPPPSSRRSGDKTIEMGRRGRETNRNDLHVQCFILLVYLSQGDWERLSYLSIRVSIVSSKIPKKLPKTKDVAHLYLVHFRIPG